jgi:hypothetical protein
LRPYGLFFISPGLRIGRTRSEQVATVRLRWSERVLFPVQHLLEEKEFRSLLGSVKAHLNPEGFFAFDVFNPSVSMLRFEFLKGGRLIFEEQFSPRVYFPLELEIMLRDTGFQVVEKFGDFEGSSFSIMSMKQIFICQTGGTRNSKSCFY